MRPVVFIQSNARQHLGALVSRFSLRRNSASPDRFDVRILQQEDHPFFRAREGQAYRRDGVRHTWRNEDLQSFTPLRFMPPECMAYRGRALVIDPDVFAVGDVWELLARDMQGKAVLCRPKGGAKGRDGGFATSVMLLDCAKLRHWRCEERFHAMFDEGRDYMDWMFLKEEDPESIGALEEEWNDFDRLTPRTKLLHNTKRWTQPWKTGLPVDFTPADKTRSFPVLGWWRRARRALLGPHGGLGRYRRHPDPAQERLFFSLLREALEAGDVDETLLRDEMRRNHLRHDALELIERTPRRAA